MKTFLLFFVLSASFLSHAQPLDQRAQKFAALIADTEASEKKYVKRIVRYFDPETNADSIAQAHYDWWRNNKEHNSYPLSCDVVGVDYPSDTEGLVRTVSVWHYPDGTTVRFLIRTQWVRRGKKWYRTPEPQTILESEQVN